MKEPLYSLRRDALFMNESKGGGWALLALAVIVAGITWPLTVLLLIALYSRFIIGV